MKLYTEFEIKFAMDIARCQPNLTFDEVLEQLTPIELPSDEEISKNAPTIPKDADDYLIANKIGFVHGAKWMREQILESQGSPATTSLNTETKVFQGNAAYNRNAYLKFVNNKVIFDNSDEEYGPIEFDINLLIDALLVHSKK